MHHFWPANGIVKQRSSSSRDQRYGNANIVPQSAQMPSHQQRRTRLLTRLVTITSKKPDERPFSTTQSIPQASIAESTQELYKKDISTACRSFELSTNKHYHHDSPHPQPAPTYPSHASISSSETVAIALLPCLSCTRTSSLSSTSRRSYCHSLCPTRSTVAA